MEHFVKTEAETGVMLPQAKKCLGPAAAGRTICGNMAVLITLISDFEPPEL